MDTEDVEYQQSAATSTERASPADLVAFLPYACRALQLEVAVSVATRAQEEYVSRAPRATRSRLLRGSGASRARLATLPSAHVSTTALAPAAAARPPADDSEEDEPDLRCDREQDRDRGFTPVPVTATLGAGGHVLELEVARVRVPRALVQVIALAAPHNPSFARMSLRGCRLRGEVVHELAKPAFAALTDVCLDDSPVPEGNYAALLDDDRLQRLSLARVRLTDGECAELAAQLQLPRPAARSLRVLELGSNAVGDAGAAALARALRTNRALMHLNLVGNRVGDEGAAELLRVLTPFPLTASETYAARRRRFAHMRSTTRTATASQLREVALPRAVEEARRGRRPGRGATSRTHHDETEERAVTLAIPLAEAFAPSEIVWVEGRRYCIGNRVLCYLNLAYNWVSAPTTRRLARALHAQEATRRALVRVVLDGNPLPGAGVSRPMAAVQELLERAVAAAVAAAAAAPRSDLLPRGRSLRFGTRTGR